MGPVAAELIITGVVHGVGYRYYCYRKAQALSVKGWVANRHDGSVAVWAEGVRSAVEALIVELKLGPPASTVTNVAVKWREFSGRYDSFNIEMG